MYECTSLVLRAISVLLEVNTYFAVLTSPDLFFLKNFQRHSMLMLSQYGHLCRDSSIQANILLGDVLCYKNKIFPDPVCLQEQVFVNN